MIKKKVIGLSILLLVLLLGLSSTTYARELTDDDIKNFIYNYCIFYGYTEEQAENIVDSFVNLPNANDNTQLEIDRWKNIANNLYPGQYILYGSYNRIGLWRYGGTDYNMRLYGPYYYHGYDSYSINANSSFLNSWNTTYSLANPNSLTTTVSNNSASLVLGANENQFFFYTDTNVYTNSTIANGSVKYAAGYMTPNNLFDGSYGADYFTFLLSSTLQTLTINGDSVPYFNFNSNTANDYHLGMLGLAEYYDYAELFEYRYKFGQWKLNKITRIDNIGPVEQNLISVDLPGRYFASNTLYSIQFNPDPDSGFDPYSQPFYMKDRNTVITNGALDTGQTFSGDYYNNYNNDTNTQEIINNTNDDSQVDNTLNEFISGDVEDVANKFGFRLFTQEYYDFIYYTVTEIVDVLTETGDVYFDYSMHGETPTRIYSSSFTTPNGTLKTFLQMFLISCTVFVFYKYIADLLELISTGNILEALDEFKVDRNIFKM